MIVRSRDGFFGGSVMASKRRETSVKAEEQARTVDSQVAIMMKPSVTVVDIATGDAESIWIWELED
jgi:hypothetical protein